MSTQRVLREERETREAETQVQAEVVRSSGQGRNEFGELFKEAKSEAAEAVAAVESALISKAFRAAFAVLAEVVLGSQNMVRRVGPNERPEERFEFEKLDHRNVRGPGSRVF